MDRRFINQPRIDKGGLFKSRSALTALPTLGAPPRINEYSPSGVPSFIDEYGYASNRLRSARERGDVVTKINARDAGPGFFEMLGDMEAVHRPWYSTKLGALSLANNLGLIGDDADASAVIGDPNDDLWDDLREFAVDLTEPFVRHRLGPVVGDAYATSFDDERVAASGDAMTDDEIDAARMAAVVDGMDSGELRTTHDISRGLAPDDRGMWAKAVGVPPPTMTNPSLSAALKYGSRGLLDGFARAGAGNPHWFIPGLGLGSMVARAAGGGILGALEDHDSFDAMSNPAWQAITGETGLVDAARSGLHPYDPATQDELFRDDEAGAERTVFSSLYNAALSAPGGFLTGLGASIPDVAAMGAIPGMARGETREMIAANRDAAIDAYILDRLGQGKFMDYPATEIVDDTHRENTLAAIRDRLGPDGWAELRGAIGNKWDRLAAGYSGANVVYDGPDARDLMFDGRPVFGADQSGGPRVARSAR